MRSLQRWTMAKRVKTPAMKANPGGRPRAPQTTAEARKRADKDLAGVQDRQRRECKAMAKAIEAALKLKDYGAGRNSSPTAALGTLMRMMATLHERESKIYDTGNAGAGMKAVFQIPAVLTIEDWAESAGQVIPEARAKAPDPTAGRHIEDQIQGTPPPDWEPPEEDTP